MLVRGVWDKHGEKVQPGGLPSIAPLVTENPSREDLARWLTSSENPLTARVLVNHLWQLCFGTGIVKTAEDFGLQGERPSHPELLDWLAVECVESGWNIKHLLKLMVMSSTYRQSSRVEESLQARDPKIDFWLVVHAFGCRLDVARRCLARLGVISCSPWWSTSATFSACRSVGGKLYGTVHV